MKIWDYIKDKLFNRKKALPEPTGQTQAIGGKPTVPNTKKEAFDAAIKVDIDIKPNTLDFAIDQYVRKVFEQNNSGKLTESYYALVEIGAIKNQDSENNRIHQQHFLENLRKDMYGWKTDAGEQCNKDGTRVNFYHIYNKNLEDEDEKYRIYLNCSKKNVALLAEKLAIELENQDYHFKFCADENTLERAEQFVFYIKDDEDLNRKFSVIEKINRENPELFKGAHNVNPFMKIYEGYIACTPQVNSGQYIDLNGNIKKIAKSYNDLLSSAIEDACITSIKKISKEDLNIKGDEDIYRYSSIKELAESKLLEYVYDDPNLKMKFIESVKQNLKLASERNPELDIKGIDTKARTQQKTTSNTMIQDIPENY